MTNREPRLTKLQLVGVFLMRGIVCCLQELSAHSRRCQRSLVRLQWGLVAMCRSMPSVRIVSAKLNFQPRTRTHLRTISRPWQQVASLSRDGESLIKCAESRGEKARHYGSKGKVSGFSVPNVSSIAVSVTTPFKFRWKELHNPNGLKRHRRLWVGLRPHRGGEPDGVPTWEFTDLQYNLWFVSLTM